MNWAELSKWSEQLQARGTDFQKRVRGLRRRLALLLAVVGPGLITSNVDNDAAGFRCTRRRARSTATRCCGR
jgi:hypothetical protein